MKFRLIESKLDQQKLIDFAGEKIANQFFDNRKFYKSPENDIYYWLKKSPEELKDFMDKNKTKNQKTNTEIDEILEMPEANDVDLVAKQDGYTIYKINTPEASVKYGLVVGGKAGWCISGGYYDGKEDGGILKEATHYFKQYLDERYTAYYFVIGHNTKYALCVKYIYGHQAVYEIWDQKDNTVDYIPYLSDLYTYKNVLLYKQLEEFKISNGELIKFTNVNNVSEFTIPDGVTSIGEYAFYNCTGLTSVTIPDSVTSIGYEAFYKCTGLTSIDIPDSVTSIGWSAFQGCTGLKSITIPDSVKSIGNEAFRGCTGLTSITIPDSVTSIGGNVFINCKGLKNITIPDSVTSIRDGAFCGCTSLKSITIPNSVTRIGASAFMGCKGLTIIVIPDSVISIGGWAFAGCTGLESIIFKGTKSQWKNIEKGELWDRSTGNYTIDCVDGDIKK